MEEEPQTTAYPPEDGSFGELTPEMRRRLTSRGWALLVDARWEAEILEPVGTSETLVIYLRPAEGG